MKAIKESGLFAVPAVFAVVNYFFQFFFKALLVMQVE